MITDLFNCRTNKLIIFLCGTGIPYALHQAGFGLGLMLLVLVAVVTDYSLVLMVRSGHLSGAYSYQGLTEAAFGKVGFILLSFLQFIYPFIGKCWQLLRQVFGLIVFGFAFFIYFGIKFNRKFVIF